MIRKIHRWPGLVALALITILALSGAVLSIFPAAERLWAPQAASEQTVADLASTIQSVYPGVEQIKRSPSGKITAYWFEGGAPGSAVIDPATGQGVAPNDPNQVLRWLTDLHRSLFLDNTGRVAMALGALSLLILAFSGAALVARRAGGWRNWFSTLRGPLSSRIHVEIARIAVVGFALSSATALWMTASTFGLVPDTETTPAFPSNVSGQTGVALSKLDGLDTLPVSQLRELTFPYPGDATDVYTLKTASGTAYLDQGTGATVSAAGMSGWQKVSETIYMLHTGEGAPLLGLVLGLMALGIPAMGATGIVIWLAGRRGRPRIRHNQAASHADTIVLVGSESGSTWGFAATLHAALSEAGHKVHVGPMSAFDPARYAHAERIVLLAATYGDGDAPASAKGFLERLESAEVPAHMPISVLGFGDRSFPDYCAFAQAVAKAATHRGWSELVPYDTVDRQSPQDFARWGRALGAAMGIHLELSHQPVLPKTRALTLVSRRDYGAEVQTPTAILRFAAPKMSLFSRIAGRDFARYKAGDLIGILPEGSPVPRFYSLASARRDGFVEIVVRKHPGGLCSGQLLSLEPGDTVEAFLRPNPCFRADRGKAPLILIGAGTGIGPLAGFVRGNGHRRPIHLFFGMRHPDSDFLYHDELPLWQDEGRLAQLTTAVSRTRAPRYVQDALRAEGAEVARLIREGARVMVCGGREMAGGVSEALADILAPIGLSPVTLKAEGRYVEDVY